MLKWFRSIDWLAINTSALVLAVGLECLSFLPRYNPADKQTTEERKDTQGDLFLGLSAGGWTALFTFFLTGSTVLLWAVTRTIASTGRKQLEVLERPWLVFTKIEPFGFPGQQPEDERGIRAWTRNAGRTPAFLTNYQGGTRYEPGEIPISKIPMKSIPLALLNHIVVQGDVGKSDIVLVREQITDDLAEAIVDGRLNLASRAIISYTDIFQNKCETAFCIQYDHKRKEFIELGGSELNYVR